MSVRINAISVILIWETLPWIGILVETPTLFAKVRRHCGSYESAQLE
jgi:hypothetical protein